MPDFKGRRITEENVRIAKEVRTKNVTTKGTVIPVGPLLSFVCCSRGTFMQCSDFYTTIYPETTIKISLRELKMCMAKIALYNAKNNLSILSSDISDIEKNPQNYCYKLGNDVKEYNRLRNTTNTKESKSTLPESYPLFANMINSILDKSFASLITLSKYLTAEEQQEAGKILVSMKHIHDQLKAGSYPLEELHKIRDLGRIITNN